MLCLRNSYSNGSDSETFFMQRDFMFGHSSCTLQAVSSFLYGFRTAQEPEAVALLVNLAADEERPLGHIGE